MLRPPLPTSPGLWAALKGCGTASPTVVEVSSGWTFGQTVTREGVGTGCGSHSLASGCGSASQGGPSKVLGLPEPFLSDGLQDASSCAASMVWFRGCGDGVPRALALPPRFLCPRPHRTSPRGHLPEGEETTPRVPAESHVSHVLEF